MAADLGDESPVHQRQRTPPLSVRVPQRKPVSSINELTASARLSQLVLRLLRKWQQALKSRATNHGRRTGVGQPLIVLQFGPERALVAWKAPGSQFG